MRPDRRNARRIAELAKAVRALEEVRGGADYQLSRRAGAVGESPAVGLRAEGVLREPEGGAAETPGDVHRVPVRLLPGLPLDLEAEGGVR